MNDDIVYSPAKKIHIVPAAPFTEKDEALRLAREALALLEPSGVWLILRLDERRSIREALAAIKAIEGMEKE